jgi:hypothetical protein
VSLVWREIHWRRPVEVKAALGLLRVLAADGRSPRLVCELRATANGVRYLLGMPEVAETAICRLVGELVPGTSLTPLTTQRGQLTLAKRIRTSTSHRPLEVSDPVASVRAVLASTLGLTKGEELVIQLVLGPRRVPLAVPANTPSVTVEPLWKAAWYGNGERLDSEKRAALRAKVSEHGFACVLRIGVKAGTSARSNQLVLSVLAGLRASEAPGIQLRG